MTGLTYEEDVEECKSGSYGYSSESKVFKNEIKKQMSLVIFEMLLKYDAISNYIKVFVQITKIISRSYKQFI